MVKFTIPGEPRTKKNHQRILRTKDGRPFVSPSEQYKEYEEYAGWFVPNETIDYPVNLKVLYYMGTRRTVDLCNLLESTCDILVRYKLIPDDSYKWVKGHDGSRVLYDKQNPRAEIFIERFKE